jgi:hypothetical protein
LTDPGSDRQELRLRATKSGPTDHLPGKTQKPIKHLSRAACRLATQKKRHGIPGFFIKSKEFFQANGQLTAKL